MKSRMLLCLLTLALCGGCSNFYRVTLNNGTYFTSRGKPHLNKETNRYVFKDTSGEQKEVSVLLVREIAPQSRHADENPNFLPKP